MTDLKRMMDEAGVKQKTIAKKAGVSPAAVSLVVNGKSVSARISQLIMEECRKTE